PLQDLLDQVVKVDEALHHAVTEIEDITRRMLQQDVLCAPDTPASGLTAFDQHVLDFLTSGQQSKERLSEVWTCLEQQNGLDVEIDVILISAEPTSNPVFGALDNIETLVDLRLDSLISADKRLTPVRLPITEHLLTNTSRHNRSKPK